MPKNLNASSCSILLLLIMFVISCGKEESIYTVSGEEPGNKYVNPVFVPYLESFKSEASIRDIDVSDINVSIEFDNTLNPDYSGYCTYSGSAIHIHQATWNNLNDCDKERLIFHEIGHCYLQRSHRNDIQNERWISIMRGEGMGFPNSEISNNVAFYEPYRSYYIDELFDNSTPTPTWFDNEQIELFPNAGSLVFSNATIDYKEMNFELDLENYRMDILLDSNIVHQAIVIDQNGTFSLNSLTINDDDTEININLINGKVNANQLCENNDFENTVTENISLLFTKEATQILLDEQYKMTTKAINSSFSLSTKLISGIKKIEIFEL